MYIFITDLQAGDATVDNLIIEDTKDSGYAFFPKLSKLYLASFYNPFARQ